MPRDTPTSSDVRDGAVVTIPNVAERVPYALVALKPTSLTVANRSTHLAELGYRGLPQKGPSSENVRLGVGDLLGVTIFEAASGGLFIPSEAGSRAGNFVQVPQQQVDSSGFIDVPYAGSIKVAGITARAASAEIARRLASRAIEPQVVVSINERRGNDISVFGEVNQPARFSLDPGGIRLVGAIARSGGSRYPAYETIVTIQRNNASYHATLSSIINNPAQNVQLLSGDVVYLSREPRYITVFGATPDPSGLNTRKITFDNDNMTMAEGLAKSSGLQTTRADPRSVFVFRTESKRVLQELGLDPGTYATELVPTIYSVDLTTADGIFLMNHFDLRDKDVVVASESPTVDYLKFVNVVNQTFAVPSGIGIGVATAVR